MTDPAYVASSLDWLYHLCLVDEVVGFKTPEMQGVQPTDVHLCYQGFQSYVLPLSSF